MANSHSASHRQRTVGYLLLTETGHPMRFGRVGKSTYAHQSTTATLFPTREAAWDAWRATVAYVEKKGWNWHLSDWSVKRVVAPR